MSIPLWEQQKHWKSLTAPLTQDSQIHSQLNNLITFSYWNFREQKKLPKGTYTPEINFQGFQGWQDFPEINKMGHCEANIATSWQTLNGQKIEDSETYEATLSIILNQKYLLSKLGMNEFITDYRETEEGAKWNTLLIGFDQLIETIAHELAHAYQNTINLTHEGKKSQCESSGDRDSDGNLLHPQLAAEHTQFMEEIQQMIINFGEYQAFKKWWNSGMEKITWKIEREREREREREWP